MTQTVPVKAREFITEFMPEQFQIHRSAFPANPITDASATLEVLGEGMWNIRLAEGKVVITEGDAPDRLLRLGLTSQHFKNLFVRRAQHEISETGSISSESRDAFQPFFLTPKKKAFAGQSKGTLVLAIDDDGDVCRLIVTPGPKEPGEPRAVVHLSMDTFFELLRTGDATRLWMSGKIKFEGDAAYALAMSVLLQKK